MPTRRKQLQQHTIKRILQERKIVIFYRYSNIGIKEWESIKKKLSSVVASDASTPLITLLVKNRIGEVCIASKRFRETLLQGKFRHMSSTLVENLSQESVSSIPFNSQKWASSGIEDRYWAKLFQGPTLLFACHSHDEMVLGCKIIDRETSVCGPVTVLGGMYHGKMMTHLDLAYLSKLDSRVYESFTFSLQEKVGSLLNFGLSFHQSRLPLYLDYYANSFK